ncbi:MULTISPECIES: response regulator transcription factor [Sphingobacterium]|jgi:two-component system invasion response regulator UvrY|uniref:response regulator transcription factor n=1 Tax=Sphingobacterium TaxID=28453 RepID=UPI0004E5F2C8|nr:MULTISPECIES: response regulator transcription factor [Sphingobacterium]CDS92686.1 Transcriptional regulator [Sphingobacterium sp. PM2-P1-29]SJN50578.1 two component transcriptional regulator, LuxR family [Sphingobacterium faecium PCAi_F2.5]UPZ36841.1 response regulator transcription factor [Sphingobacterium sp. PCS056]UXD68365.1 response regulator transcription factor [Sphingobacterium faecium]WGQ16068.1 response regulator transcription factor [Sphingobacterium faecium]
MKKILIADDHSIVRLGASVIIKESMPECVITQAQDYNEVLKLLQEEVFDLLLLDINMPGGNNIRVVKEILEIQESIKILIFSSYDESLYALRYIEAGAAGFVNKSTAMAELSNAILTIRERGKYMSDEVKDLYVKKLTQSKSKLNTMNPLSRLSNREVDVAKYLIQGHGIIEVSTTLDLSPSTVSTYKSRIFEKLNVSNIPELIEIFRIHSAN